MNIAVTAGDPAGIGLEVVFKALPPLLGRAHWVLVAEPADFHRARERFAPSLAWSPYEDFSESLAPRVWLRPCGASVDAAEWGEGNAETGRRALAALEAAAECAAASEVLGVVTAPLSKRLVGPDFQGQTERLAALDGGAQAAMSFFTPTFKVVLATTHLSLVDAVESLTRERYVRLLALVDAEIRNLGYSPPRIGVAAVNPHAGEGGMFGSEDDEILAPAIAEARALGIDAAGPFPADSLYPRAHAGQFDVVVAPYHDQGLIPVKLLAPRASANVTLGLSYVRTSPDHGTAFDIAGQGIADPGGMQTAMEWCLELCLRRRTARRHPAGARQLRHKP